MTRMQGLYNSVYIFKLLIYGMYREGIKVLFKSILKNLFLVCLILCLLVYLCSREQTSFVSWLIIGIFAVIAVIKAIYEICILLKRYFHKADEKDKEYIIILMGGKLFDIAISAIGVLQAGKIMRHSVQVANSANSAISLVDDVIAVISKITKDFFK